MTPRVLLYLRKSTDEHQADSIDTQRAGAGRFVEVKLKGEVVREIVDEGESRAEFKRRPGFARLLALCASKDRDFDTIVVRDESRLGAGARLTVALDDILAAGVRVFYYASGEEVQLDSAEQKIMTAIKAAMAENERAKTAERTRESHERKAGLGWNVGGRCYGYDNVRIDGSDGKSHTEFKINVEQAAIIVEMCCRFANGESERSIAHALNARGVPPPRAGKRGTGSWSPSCVREIIRRPRYRGLLEWGHVGAAYRGGTRVTFTRKRAEIVAVERSDLRIIPADLDDRIQARIEELKKHTTSEKRPGGMGDYEGRAARYLLSGKAVSKCGTCGGPMQVANSKQGARIIKVYVCGWHRDRGPDVCTNSTRRPVESVDGALVEWLRENVLTEQVITAALKEVHRRLRARAKSAGSELATLEAQIGKLDREIKRLVAVAGSLDEDDKPEELAGQIEEKTRRRRELRARLDAERAAPEVLDLAVEQMEKEARKRLADFRALLGRNPAEARRSVETLIKAPIAFHPATNDAGKPRFELSGSIVTGAVFSNLGDPDGI